MRAHVNIGSNLGNREENIRRAVEGIRAISEGDFRVSSTVECEAWGYASENAFLNVGVGFECSLEPIALLRRLRAVEAAISRDSHRKDDGTYADRLIDIDLICYGRVVMVSEELTLPHPRAHLREFVMGPLREIDPEMWEWLVSGGGCRGQSRRRRRGLRGC